MAAAVNSRKLVVRSAIVSGSPTVGGLGGYFSAGSRATAMNAPRAILAPRSNSLRPAMRWCSAATATPKTRPITAP
jgi:hypothetical protein